MVESNNIPTFYFATSEDLSFGMELELQIVSPYTGALAPSSIELLEALNKADEKAAKRCTLEATLATIEMNTSVHIDADAMLEEAQTLVKSLTDVADAMNLLIRGGGTHMTQFWNDRVVAPTERAQELTKRFGFLPKRFSTYGMHVHIGASSVDHALLIGNGLQALVPLFIALSAASPFLQMTDTGFCAARPLEPLVYPHGGPMPRFKSWSEFQTLAADIFSTELAFSLKDIYWDVRPKPEFGTVEVRVFDTPLSVHKAVALAAFTRACARLILDGSLVLPDTPSPPTAERVSRFMACRDGLEAVLFDPFEQVWKPARLWFSNLCEMIKSVCGHTTDLQHIQALHESSQAEQDYQLMRDAWQDAHAPYRQALDVLLVHYSNTLSSLLLKPFP